MINNHITLKLTNYTCLHSNFERKRDYISLSAIVNPIEDIIKKYEDGDKPNEIDELRCYKGYQMEKDLCARISAVFPDHFKAGSTVTAHSGKIKILGHPDFWFDNDHGDCKSVLRDDWLPEPGKLPKRVFWQMQGYMLYSQRENALVVYESRESGVMQDYWLKPNKEVQKEIADKVNTIIARYL